MNRRLSAGRICLVAGIAAAVVVALVGGLGLARQLSVKPVPVYEVSQVTQSGFYFGGDTLMGDVRADRMQKVFLSDTQTIAEMKVSEGDMVQAGDVLATFDTSLTKIDVEKARIAAEKRKLELSDAGRELERLRKASASEGLEGELAALEARRSELLGGDEEPVVEYPELPLGDFTLESPRYVALGEGDISAADLLNQAGADEAYVVFVELMDGVPMSYTGMRIVGKGAVDGGMPGYGESDGVSTPLDGTEGGDAGDTDDAVDPSDLNGSASGPVAQADVDAPDICWSFFAPEPLAPRDPDDDQLADAQARADAIEAIDRDIARVQELLAASYPKAQLAVMIADEERRIKKLEADVSLADLDYRRKAAEMGDGTIVATESGRVVTAEQYPTAGNPALVVSAGGGMLVNASVSEYDRDSLAPGDTVSVTSWNTGLTCEGTIQSVGTQPSGTESYGFGTTETSLYTALISLPDDAAFPEGDYVEVSLGAEGSQDGRYLPNMFIRYEDGRPFVYVAGEDGLLQQRFLTIGNDLWGELTEVKGGLDDGEFIAFPYGSDVFEGAQTTPGSLEDLMVY